MTNPATGPRFRLAPGVVLGGGTRHPPLPDPGDGGAGPGAQGFRNTRWDHPSLTVTRNPAWLLAPLYARAAALLAVAGGDLPGPLRALPPDLDIAGMPVTAGDADAAAADWPAWWRSALAYRPGTPAPRQEDLVAGSAALRRLWTDLAEPFARWAVAAAPRYAADDAPARTVERAALAGFFARNGREPGRWTVRLLEIPVTGRYLHSPEPRRIVVSADLRAAPDGYAAALAAELPRHF